MSDLTISHVSAAYDKLPALSDVSLVAAAGQIVGLIGPNGAGKSTLLRALSGTLAPSSGSVHLGSLDLLGMSAAERARRVAMVPQLAHLPEGFSVVEVVLMGRAPHLPRFGGERARDYEIARQAMQRTDIWDLAERQACELSGGEQQRVLLARALAQEPQVLLLGGGRLLADDAPAQVLTPGWLRAAYDVEAMVGTHPLYGTPLVALVSEDNE